MNLFDVLLYFFLHRSFQLIHVGSQILHTTKLRNQFDSGLFSHTGATRYIVGCISHQGEQVDHLRRRIDAVLRTHFVWSQDFHPLATMSGAAHSDTITDELCVVLVGCDHRDLESLRRGLLGERADHIVGLESGLFDDRDVVCCQDFLDDGHTQFDILGRSLSLRLILRVSLVSERWSSGIKGYGNVVGIFFFQKILQGIDKTKNCRSIHTF